MNHSQIKGRLTLGGLMILIAALAWIMASYRYAARENARTLEAELAKADADLKREIAANEAEAAKEAEMERKNDEAMAKAQEALERAKQPQPQPPPISRMEKQRLEAEALKATPPLAEQPR